MTYLGLTEEMLLQIKQDPELAGLITLHEKVQHVKDANQDNSVKIGELKELFKNLRESISGVFKEQGQSMASTKE